MAPLPGVEQLGDPLGAEFPKEAYRSAIVRRGHEPGQIVGSREADNTPPESGRVLIDVGSALRSFSPMEVTAGAVPDSLERPELARLRDDYTFEPLLTREIATAQHPAISLRLRADWVPAIELGFYWLRPRDGEAR